MKRTAIFVLIVFLFGCIQINPKNQENLDQNQMPQTDQNNFGQQQQEENPPQQDLPPQPPTEPTPPPEPPEPIPPQSKGWVTLTVNSQTHDLQEGKFVEVNGSQNFSGKKFKVVLESIQSTGTEYSARFLLQDTDGTIINEQSFFAGDELSFETQSGEIITIDALLVVEGVYS